MITPTKTILTRRNILRGMFAAPAIIAIDNLMPVKAYSALIKPKQFDYAYVSESVWIAPFQIEKIAVTAKTRKLSVEWTSEQPQHIKHIYDPSIETMIINMLKEQKPL